MLKLWLKMWTMFLANEPRNIKAYARLLRVAGVRKTLEAAIRAHGVRIETETAAILENEELCEQLNRVFCCMEKGNVRGAYRSFVRYMQEAVDVAPEVYDAFWEALEEERMRHTLRVVA